MPTRQNYHSKRHIAESGSKDFLGLNQTLGFSKIFAINLDHRRDRREKILQMANYSDLLIELEPGVLLSGKEPVHQFSLNEVPVPHAKMGCYLAHLNVWKKIRDGSITTALILEDDVDWDIDMKVAMSRFQASLSPFVKPERTTQENLNDWREGDWDILRLGTCNDPPRDNEKTGSYDIKVYRDDTTADRQSTTYEHIETFDHHGIPLLDRMKTESQHNSQFRIIKRSHYPVCLHAYAISKQGAEKLIKLTSKGLLDGANDLTIARFTQQGQLRSFSVIPPLFGQFKISNWKGNSDISHSFMGDESGQRYTYDIRYGVRTNILESDVD